ncbi:hypothetical protein ONZ45_g12416 [Pleurotus djamor]|nr:hypothetical protein ONZ45_g12416 [Pleurotus djamor]
MKSFFVNCIALVSLAVLPAIQGQVFGTDHAAGKSLTFSTSKDGAADGVPTPRGGHQRNHFKAFLPPSHSPGWVILPTRSTKEQRINFGAYEGTDTASNFKDYGIPDGSIIDVILDVSASSDIDLDIWWTADSQSPCVAIYSCHTRSMASSLPPSGTYPVSVTHIRP